ncbi:MAG: Hsp70 family protein [Polyangiaceae bacterium]
MTGSARTRIDRAVGIDLGTTNSEIAWLSPNERDLLIYADKFGRKTVPSAVAWNGRTKEFVVGHAARNMRGGGAPLVESIKRSMGQTTTVALGDGQLTPAEVSAKILGELAARMREHLTAQVGDELDVVRAVITVPAYFDGPQVEATRKAGELAGLTVCGILQEPTAAAMYHAWKHDEIAGDGNILVYDLGGGTFDVSILRVTAGEYHVLAIEGDNYLGGDDFDRRFAEVLRTELCASGYALELDVGNDAEDRKRFQRLVHLAQEIKEALSTSQVVSIAKAEFVVDKNGESVSFQRDVGREEYESVIRSYVESTIACCERALAESARSAEVSVEHIDHVILVGGSTRVPMVVRAVREAIVERSRGKHLWQDEVDTSVALGAAVFAASSFGTILRSTEPEGAIRMTSPFASSREKVRLGFERLPSGAEAERAKSAALWSGETMLGECALGPVGKVERIEAELPLGSSTPVVLALQTDLGTPVSEFSFTLHCGEVRPRPSPLTRASVLAKDLGIEVVRAGKRARRSLIARGTGLPARTSEVFYTGDQSGAVTLRILQNRLPIKTLVISVPTTLAVGSPVEVTISCDESMRIQATAEVGNERVSAVVEAPELLELDPEGHTDALLASAEEVSRSLWGTVLDGYRRDSERLIHLLRESLRTDPSKAKAIFGQLRDLVEEHRGRVGEDLSPPMHVFEHSLDQLRRVVYRASDGLLGLSRADWEKKIASLETRGAKAYEDNDTGGWRRVINEAQALAESAGIEDWAKRDPFEPGYLTRRHQNACIWARELEGRLAKFAGEGGHKETERARIEAWIDEQVTKPLKTITPTLIREEASEVSRVLSDAASEMERIEAAIDRLPSLGLVTDRGQKRVPAPGEGNTGGDDS